VSHIPNFAARKLITFSASLLLMLSSAVTQLAVPQLAQAATGVIADSVSDFSGTQGQNNWYYGYYADPTHPSLTQMPDFVLNYHPTFGSTWFADNNQYWTSLWAIGGHPQSINTSGGRIPTNQWAVRRWTSPTAGQLTVSGVVAKLNGDGGDGTIEHILVDGTEVWSKTIGGFDTTDAAYRTQITVNVGSNVDFAIDPNTNDLADATKFTATISGDAPAVPVTVHATVLMGSALTHGLSSPRVGMFWDPTGDTNPADFSGTVDWGDGQQSAPTIFYSPNLSDCTYLAVVPTSGSCFTARADHDYARARHQPYIYDLTIRRGDATATDIGVAEAPGNLVVPGSTVKTKDINTDAVGLVSGRLGDVVFDCTATVVDTPTANIIVTASHCLAGHTDFSEIQFAPGHTGGICGGKMVIDCGTNRLGVWRVTDPAHAIYNVPGGVRSDVTFIVLPPRAGVQVQNAVKGGFPINFFYDDAPQNQPWSVFGYATGYTEPKPSNPKLISCEKAAGRTIPEGITISPTIDIGASDATCNFGAGTSGAPWINSVNTLPGAISGVNHGSYGTNCNEQGECQIHLGMYATAFNTAAAQTLNRAVRGLPASP
jgi:hypothetical protein